MTDFIKAYLDLLIYQYRDLPNASAEIQAIIEPFSDIFDFYNSFETKFDLDVATGEQLDIIGRIVGQDRKVYYTIAKPYLGFQDVNANAKGFGYPFFKADNLDLATLDLDDNQYRVFIKMKVAFNNMYNNVFDIAERVFNALNGYGYIKDNNDLTLTFYLHESLNVEFYKLLLILDKLPRPSGISYNNYIIIYDDLGNETTYNL